MCLTGLFKRPVVALPEITDNTVYHFAAGNYPGTGNDLPGPQYDQKRICSGLSSTWDNYVFRKYLDSTTTRKAFLADLEAAVARIKPGDLLVFISDYCFPGTSTDNTVGVRASLVNPKVKVLKERFVPGPYIAGIRTRSTALRNIGAGNYIAMSACPDWQTALDVEINGKKGGLFHFALEKTKERGITWKQWTERAREYVKQLGFDRFPIIEGPDSLINRKIFEDPTQCFILSMHGSWTIDLNGDESDGKDEGPYFPDGLLIDDKINATIAKNAYLI
jgi:hypothetical protein